MRSLHDHMWWRLVPAGSNNEFHTWVIEYDKLRENVRGWCPSWSLGVHITIVIIDYCWNYSRYLVNSWNKQTIPFTITHVSLAFTIDSVLCYQCYKINSYILIIPLLPTGYFLFGLWLTVYLNRCEIIKYIPWKYVDIHKGRLLWAHF